MAMEDAVLEWAEDLLRNFERLTKAEIKQRVEKLKEEVVRNAKVPNRSKPRVSSINLENT